MAKELAALLSTGTWTHDYPITVEEAQRLGLKVRSDIDADAYRERFSSQSITARGSSALFDGLSAAVDSDSVGAADSAGLTGVTARSGRVSTLAVAGGLAGTD